jgi:hypothetical protein
MTQGKLLGITTNEIPGDADKGEEQHPNENVDREPARYYQRQREQNRPEQAKPKHARDTQSAH